MSDKGFGKVIKKAIPKSVLNKLGIKQKKVTPVELKKLKEKAKLKSEKVKPIDNSTIAKLKNKLQNAMPEAQIKALRKKLNELEKGKKKQEVTKTLEKEKKRQLNVNKNQKSGGGVNKIVKGDESKDALKTAPMTQKELKAQGAVSGPSSMAFMAAIKGKAKVLAEQVQKKQKLYDALSTSDKRGEKGQLLQNAIKDMQKKLKGQVPIRTLRDANLLNKGGMAMPKPNQTGLKKLPTAVRNKMGYMYGGGMAKKNKTGSMDYRKGGLVVMIGMGKPKKGTK